MDSFFQIHDSALLISLVRFHRFFDYIYAFNDNSVSLEVDSLIFLLAFIFSCKDLNGVVHFQLLHILLKHADLD